MDALDALELALFFLGLTLTVGVHLLYRWLMRLANESK